MRRGGPWAWAEVARALFLVPFMSPEKPKFSVLWGTEEQGWAISMDTSMHRNHCLVGVSCLYLSFIHSTNIY